MCDHKNLRSTSEAVTLLRALTDSPYAVADALHGLRSEDRPRDIRLDEVRVALAHLDADQLLPSTAPTVSAAVAVLLRSARPQSQAEIAAAADISERSLRRHLDVLEALDLVRETEQGYRLALPFATDEERGAEIMPEAVTDATSAPQDLLFDVATVLVDDPGRLADLGGAFGWPPDFEQLRAQLPDIDPWVRVARVLCDDPDPEPATVTFGSTVEQTSIQTVDTP
jgi:DNA-binding transcriptional ArsR family regulator